MIERLPDETLSQLAIAGFVHVTGLGTQILRVEDVIKANERDLGRWNTYNGKTVLVTVDGQVWLGKGLLSNELVAELCPNGQGANIPCSYGEMIYVDRLLDRFAHPYGI